MKKRKWKFFIENLWYQMDRDYGWICFLEFCWEKDVCYAITILNFWIGIKNE